MSGYRSRSASTAHRKIKERQHDRNAKENRILTADGEEIKGTIPETDPNKSSHHKMHRHMPVSMMTGYSINNRQQA